MPIAPDAAAGEPAIVILTGAGISAASGLSTFRDPDGLWAQIDIEDVATPEAFDRHPARVHDFYNARRRQLRSSGIAPNAAHVALADLQRRWRGSFTLITQNIDDLHERAGSVGAIHMHGELLKSRCVRSGATFACPGDLSTAARCPCCGEAGTLRPHVVWFGEMPLGLDRIHAATRACDLFVAIGTSGEVYPAAGLIEVARGNGRARTVELNLERTRLTWMFDESVQGPAAAIVPAWASRL
jgi:NAD-dependent deacetylase